MLDPACLAAERILVVAPHPDDESLGCGGLIWCLGRLGRAFHVVFVTDGGASHPNSPTWPRQRLADEREKEAAEALRLLGIGQAARTFLRLRDADMPVQGSVEHAGALASAAAIIESFRPDLVLLPWRRDPHRDHRDAFGLFRQGLEWTRTRATVLEYAIWVDEIGTPEDRPRPDEMECLDFDISDAVDAKRVAVEAHRTQVTDMIGDDPGAFRLTNATIDRLVGPTETYWRPLP